jgi:alpha-beta hydrolase superfamily lysophospholipase
VWVHGAGEAARPGWGGDVVPGLVEAGVVVFSWDKRRVGHSGGSCCPGDQGHFRLITADAEGPRPQAQKDVDPQTVLISRDGG